jgi:hypothetical protein
MRAWDRSALSMPDGSSPGFFPSELVPSNMTADQAFIAAGAIRFAMGEN